MMSSQEITKEDLKKIKEEIIFEFRRGAEIISDELRLLAEKIFALSEKIERFHHELKDEIVNKTQPILRHCDIEGLQL